MVTGRVLVEADVYRVEHSHSLLGLVASPAVEKETIRLVKVPGGKFQLHLLSLSPEGPVVQPVRLDRDWDMVPASVEQIAGQARAFKAAGGAAQLSLFDFELKRKSHFMERLLHPNTAIPEADHPEGEPTALRLGFEAAEDAQEWYALLALCMGMMAEDDPQLQSLPMARSASRGLLAPDALELTVLPAQPQAA